MRPNIVLVLGLALVALSGCVTEGSYGDGGNYEGHLWAQQGENKIVTRGKDLFWEKLDGSESRQLTHTPDVWDMAARLVGEGKFVAYCESKSYYDLHPKCFIIPATGDDSQRKEISEQEFIGLR